MKKFKVGDWVYLYPDPLLNGLRRGRVDTVRGVVTKEWERKKGIRKGQQELAVDWEDGIGDDIEWPAYMLFKV